ncbi:MAG: AAA family ATPase [Candidatus Anammoxibacter sp.]
MSEQYDIVLVEGAGKLEPPVTEKLATNADLAKTLNLPLVIVAQTTVGTINQFLLLDMPRM